MMKKNGNNSASTIVLAMMTLMVLSVCAAMALRYTRTIARNTQRTHSLQEAISAGTGALDLAFVQWRAACRERENKPLPSKEIKKRLKRPHYPEMEAKQHRFLKNTPKGEPFKVGTYKIDAINATDPEMKPLPDDKAPVASQSQSHGCSTLNYLAAVEVPYQTPNGPSVAHVYRVFQKATVSPWQFAIFYNDDLEMNPIVEEYNAGWVHTNGNLFTGGCHNKNYLHFMSKVTCSKSWQIGWKETDTTRDAQTKPVSPSFAYPPVSGAPVQIPMNSEKLTENSGVNNPNLAHGLHEMIERPRASNSFSDPLKSTDPDDASPRFYYQSGVRLLVEKGKGGERVLKIYNSKDEVVTKESKGTDKILYDTFSEAVKLDTTIGDNREQATIKLVQLDISKIQPALDQGGALSNIGFHMVYVADTTATDNIATPLSAAVRGAVELVNGYKMPDLGLTIVSENPVYIRGDYNTTNNDTDVVPSNVGNTDLEGKEFPAPHAEGYTPQPCAVIADAVTILSNSWGKNAEQNYSTYEGRRLVPEASNTTVNTALLAGIVTEGLDKASDGTSSTNGVEFCYSGAADNFTRFLENWKRGEDTPAKSFTYYGSMVQLYTSRQAVGVWRGGSDYTYRPPRRKWHFDKQFLTQSPPGTFQLVSYAKSRWFTQAPTVGLCMVQE